MAELGSGSSEGTAAGLAATSPAALGGAADVVEIAAERDLKFVSANHARKLRATHRRRADSRNSAGSIIKSMRERIGPGSGWKMASTVGGREQHGHEQQEKGHVWQKRWRWLFRQDFRAYSHDAAIVAEGRDNDSPRSHDLGAREKKQGRFTETQYAEAGASFLSKGWQGTALSPRSGNSAGVRRCRQLLLLMPAPSGVWKAERAPAFRK
jgi:hypothetical protein